MQPRHLLTALVLLAASGLPAGADGIVTSTGAVLTPGTAPIAGEVTVDRCAAPAPPPVLPAIPPVGSLAPLTMPLRAFPGGGSGDDGAFHATQDVNLPGGTYEFTSYRVDAGVSVYYDDPVVIRTTGDTDLLGTVYAAPTGGGIAFHCAGTLTVGDDGRIEIRDVAGKVDLAVAGALVVGAQSRVMATDGATLTCHAPGLLDLGAIGIAGGRGDVLVQSAGGIATAGGFIVSTMARLDVVAGNGDVSIHDTFLNVLGNGLTVAASGHASVTGASNVLVGRGPVRVRAHGGDVNLDGTARLGTSDGPLELHAAGSVFVGGTTDATTTNGLLSITAFGGDVVFAATGASRFATAEGTIAVAASGDVTLAGAATLESTLGAITVDAPTGDVHCADAAALQGDGADATIRAAGVVTGMGLSVRTATLDVTAADGIDVGFSPAGAVAVEGPLRVLSERDVKLTGPVTSGGELSIASCGGDVVLSGAQVTTSDRSGSSGPSGAVTVETFGGGPSSIDVSNATLATGAADGASGDISVLARHATALLPRTVRVTPPGHGRRSPGLRLRGFLDTGPGDADVSVPATLEIGGLRMALPGLVARRGGKRFEFRDDTTLVRITPAGNGGSRARLAITLERDLSGLVDADGTLLLRYRTRDFAARGRVELAGGRFRLGRVPGALVEPGLYLSRARVDLRGAGRDAFRLSGGFAAPAGAPEAAPELRIALGDGADATIPATSFRKRGRRFLFRGDVAGVRRVVVDFRRGRVLATGRKVDFGAPDAGPHPLRFTLHLGPDERSVTVRGFRRGKRLQH